MSTLNEIKRLDFFRGREDLLARLQLVFASTRLPDDHVGLLSKRLYFYWLCGSREAYLKLDLERETLIAGVRSNTGFNDEDPLPLYEDWCDSVIGFLREMRV